MSREDYPLPAGAPHGPEGLSSRLRSPTLGRPGLAAALLAAALGLAAPAADAGLRGDLHRALGKVPRASTGAFVLDLQNGRVRFSQNATLSMRPASNQKLAVALAALDRLGPGFRIRTIVYGQGAQSGSTWQGGLILRGFGDPTLSRADMRQLARTIRARGIVRIKGPVIGDESYFDTRRTAPGWKPWHYKIESPPLSALVVNGGRLGGRMPDDQARAAARHLRRALLAEGVGVAGPAVARTPQGTAVRLARVASPRLGALLRRMNKASDNFVSEMLVKGLGARQRGAGTTAAGARVMRKVLERRGVPLAGVRLADGSGLSDLDRVTPRALAALLSAAWSDLALRGPFYASLPIAGQDGTLEDRLERRPAYGFVRAKTGTTDRSSSLSGYAGTQFVFALLMNGSPVALTASRRAQDRFVQRLARAAS